MPRTKPVQKSAPRTTAKPKPKPKPKAKRAAEVEQPAAHVALVEQPAAHVALVEQTNPLPSSLTDSIFRLDTEDEIVLAAPATWGVEKPKHPSGAAKLKAAGKRAIMLAVTPEVYARFEGAAKNENRALSNWIVTTCLRVLE